MLKDTNLVAVLMDPVMKAWLPKLNIDNDDIRQGKHALKEFMTRISDEKEDFDNVNVGVAKEQARQPANKNQRIGSMNDLSDSDDEADQEHHRDGGHAHAII